ncbi:MAG: hypothetical protein J5743_06250 [Victivallales bacterium]|nr:hypothetical protein [Victivallales bacterium]
MLHRAAVAMRFEREVMAAAMTAPDARKAEPLPVASFHQRLGGRGDNLRDEAADKPREVRLEDIDNVAQLHLDN